MIEAISKTKHTAIMAYYASCRSSDMLKLIVSGTSKD